MSKPWQGIKLLKEASQVVGASTTVQIGKEWGNSADMAARQRVHLTVSAITVTTAVSAKLQTRLGGDWIDAKSLALTTTGEKVLLIFPGNTAGDEDDLPLGSQCRLVVTTGADDTVTLTSAWYASNQ